MTQEEKRQFRKIWQLAGIAETHFTNLRFPEGLDAIRAVLVRCQTLADRAELNGREEGE